ncbi:MAG: S41 family peptidase [Anaerotignaceae bacterium]
MKKKSFYGGVITGVSAAILSFSLLNVATVVIEGKSKNSFSIENKISYIIQLLDKYYVDTVDYTKVEEGIYQGIANSIGDPYTTYLTADQFATFQESTNGAFYGIGITVLPDPEKGVLTIISTLKGTPAEAAGILPNDIIIKVNGDDVIGRDSDEVIALIKGEEGTEVTVTMRRGDNEIDFRLKRSMVETESVMGEMVEGNIGFISLTGFKNNTYEQFVEIYDKLMAEGAKGLIIDVRDNPGGLLNVVEEIADKLVPEGVLVYTIDKEGNREDYVSDSEQVTVPLCILVNENSASASEILAGAVQDMGAGKLVGNQTFGKGLVQSLFTLPDGSALKVTIQKYYTPKGVCIQGTGITPDYEVDLPESDLPIVARSEDDTQYKKAVEVIKSQQ